MGLFSSKSKSSVTNLTETVSKNIADYSTIDGPATKITSDFRDIAGPINISVLDGGAIQESFSFAGKVNESQTNIVDRALRAMQESGQRETETALFALNKASTLAPAELDRNELIKWGGIALALFVVLYAVKGGR